MATLKGRTGPVVFLDFNCFGNLLASSSEDTSIRVTDFGTDKLLHELPGYAKSVRSIIMFLTLICSRPHQRMGDFRCETHILCMRCRHTN